jgi:hypothetical protein
MKQFLLLSAAVLFIGTASAQEKSATGSVQKVDAANVPANVAKAFSEDFPTGSIIRWELHTVAGDKGSGKKYVAIFDNADKVRSRARYKEDGTGRTATEYYWGANVSKLPQGIRDYAAKKYADHKLTGAEKEINLRTDKSAYRVKLRKGAAKVTVWLNADGTEVGAKNIDPELEESQSEAGESNE